MDTPRITRSVRCEIVTSGYSDRWIRWDSKWIVTCGDPLVGGYSVQFGDERSLYNYLETCHGMSFDVAYQTVQQAPVNATMPWEHGPTSSYITLDGIHRIEQVLKVLSTSFRQDIREQIANDVQLTPNDYYALCSGLHRCNEINRLLARRGLRPGQAIIVQPEGFDLDSEFDADRVRATLVALAADPSRYYQQPGERD